MLVGAVLAPQGGEHPQLGERGRPAQQRGDEAVFEVGGVVSANQLRRDRAVAGERARLHASEALAPDSPRSTARNTRAMMLGWGWAIRLSASPASNHSPWQCVHWSIWIPCHSPVIRS